MPINIEKAVISRMIISGQRFEILVDPRKAFELRKGAKIDLQEILAYPAIYKDAKKGMEASSEDLQKFFGTKDIYKIAERIIKNGELQLTTEQRKEIIEQKKIQIATIISKRGIDPKTNAPHTTQRILNAMEKAGISIDVFEDVEQQVEKVIKAIRTLLPIKFQRIVFQLKIPAEHASKVYSQIKTFGNLSNEKWLNDGSLEFEIEILAGMQEELFQKISKLTQGNFGSKIIRRIEI